MAGILVELRSAGVNFELLEQAAERLRETDGALRREAFMLVNGDVKIVFDREEAAEALARGGLTLASRAAHIAETPRFKEISAAKSPRSGITQLGGGRL